MIFNFLNQIKNIANEFSPNATIDYKIVRATHLYFRITINEDTLIDIYFNPDTERKDLSLIYKNERIYGFDNLKGWHYHPYKEPGKHISCEEPDVGDVLKEMKKIVEGLGREFKVNLE
ncbi:MAG: hypothetical protein ABIF11_03190 [Nitrospirota bacterium]